MWIIKNRKIFYSISGIMFAFSLFAILFWGVKFGIDFTGGSILEFNYDGSKVEKSVIEDKLNSATDKIGAYSLREIGDNGYFLRTREISNDTKNEVLEIVSVGNQAKEVKFSTIGPTLGNELKNRAILAVIVVMLAISLYIAFVFRQVSKPVSSWFYGWATILAFLHDVIFPIGLFAVLGIFGVEVDTLFVVAVLVVLGYSINDTIVVFDRVRENLLRVNENQRASDFEEIVGRSLKETFARSINTTLTVLIALLAVYFLGGHATEYFALAMIAGVVSGAYSSIFIAAPLLVTFRKFQQKREKSKK